MKFDASKLSRDEQSILLYMECCLVDQGGILEGVRMNSDDHANIAKFKAAGLIDSGRVPARLLSKQPGSTNWVTFTPEAWTLVSQLRQIRAKQRGPFAKSVFDLVAERAAA